MVLAGVALGLAMTAVVGVLTFVLERRLPYKRMLIVTGVLISLVLVVMVGNTARTLQGVGWLSITPLDIEFPLWMGTWLGIFPTVESLVAQAAAFAFVIGSYFLAEWARKRHLRRTPRGRERPQPSPAEPAAAAPEREANRSRRRRPGRAPRRESAYPPPAASLKRPSGGVAEWLNAAVSKTVMGRFGPSRVRIPPPPF